MWQIDANYNSLQISVNRRLARGLQFGVNYTFSKTLGVADSDSSSVSPYFPARSRNYGPSSFDRTNVLVINYLYELPKFAGRLHFRPAHWVLDDWQLSGITSFISGAPFVPGFTTTKAAAGQFSAAVLRLWRHQFLQLWRQFPAVGTFGNAGVGI
jgi:hypothetical protein